MKGYWILLLSLLPAMPVAAERFHSSPGATLVELYTSEGCSSCPPADAWLSTLAQRPELFKTLYPVGFHVDYWNALGWPDRFSNPAFSARQRDYVRQGLVSQVYTPGLVVNGHEWRQWFRGARQLPAGGLDGGRLVLERHDGVVSATYAATGSDTSGIGSLRLNLVYLGMGLHSEVTRGENRGRRLQHDFVVLGFWQQQSNDGRWRLTLPAVPDRGQQRTALVGWVSEGDSVVPRQAAGGYLQ